jgi:hypothetical protein
VAARVLNAAAVDDSSPAGGSAAAEDSAAADSSPVAAEDDCSGSDIHCARAVATGGSYPDDSSQVDCLAQVDSLDDSVASLADVRSVPVVRRAGCSPDGSCPGGCCLDDCSEPAGSAEADSLDSADLAQAGSAAVDSAEVCCLAGSNPADCLAALTVDDHFAQAVQTDDFHPEPADSRAGLAADDCWVDSSPDECSPAVDCPAAGDSPQDYSFPAAHSERADF